MMVNLSEYRHPLGFINQLRIFSHYEQNEMTKVVNISPLKCNSLVSLEGPFAYYRDLTVHTLGPHGGLLKNNLNDILRLENDADSNFENEIRFKLSYYNDDQTMQNYCTKNKNALN